MNQVIPLASTPNQSFSCRVNINNGKSLNLKFELSFNDVAQYWTLKLSNADDKTVYLTGLPLVPGDYPAGNIIDQYSYLKIGSAYLIKRSDLAYQLPQSDNLDTDWVLVWGDNR